MVKYGHPMLVVDTVMCYATKPKGKYDWREAKVERLNRTQAVITMHEGLAQGEKRKVEYKCLELWSSPRKFCFPQVVSPPASLREIPLRQALRGQWRRAPSALGPMCKYFFGDLSMMD